MSQVADTTLLFFSRFALTQWRTDELARRGSGRDPALRQALTDARSTNPDKLIRKWENKHPQSMAKLRAAGLFKSDSWHAKVLAGCLNDNSRPLYIQLFSERELGASGRHAHFPAAYEELRRLRNFIAHNMALQAVPEEERLAIGWFHDEPYGPWLEIDNTRIDLAFLMRAVEVAEWTATVVAWTHWKISHGYMKGQFFDGTPFSDDQAPEDKPPYILGLPAYKRATD